MKTRTFITQRNNISEFHPLHYSKHKNVEGETLRAQGLARRRGASSGPVWRSSMQPPDIVGLHSSIPTTEADQVEYRYTESGCGQPLVSLRSKTLLQSMQESYCSYYSSRLMNECHHPCCNIRTVRVYTTRSKEGHPKK